MGRLAARRQNDQLSASGRSAMLVAATVVALLLVCLNAAVATAQSPR